MNPLAALSGGLNASPSSSAASTGGQFGAGFDLSSSWGSPFAVGDGASATATGPVDQKAMLWIVGGAAVLAIGAVLISRRR